MLVCHCLGMRNRWERDRERDLAHWAFHAYSKLKPLVGIHMCKLCSKNFAKYLNSWIDSTKLSTSTNLFRWRDVPCSQRFQMFHWKSLWRICGRHCQLSKAPLFLFFATVGSLWCHHIIFDVPKTGEATDSTAFWSTSFPIFNLTNLSWVSESQSQKATAFAVSRRSWPFAEEWNPRIQFQELIEMVNETETDEDETNETTPMLQSLLLRLGAC